MNGYQIYKSVYPINTYCYVITCVGVMYTYTYLWGSNSFLALSISASSTMSCLSKRLMLSCSNLSTSSLNNKLTINSDNLHHAYIYNTHCILRIITYLAEASWELVVISMAEWTDFFITSRVLWSTGSTDWMSILVMTRLLAGNSNLFRTFWFSSNPNTDVRIILTEFYKETPQPNKQHVCIFM